MAIEEMIGVHSFQRRPSVKCYLLGKHPSASRFSSLQRHLPASFQAVFSNFELSPWAPNSLTINTFLPELGRISVYFPIN